MCASAVMPLIHGTVKGQQRTRLSDRDRILSNLQVEDGLHPEASALPAGYRSFISIQWWHILDPDLLLIRTGRIRILVRQRCSCIDIKFGQKAKMHSIFIWFIVSFFQSHVLLCQVKVPFDRAAGGI